MPIALPVSNSTSWYDHYSQLDGQASNSVPPTYDDFHASATTTLASRNSGKLPTGETWNLAFNGPTTADLKIVNNVLRLDAAGASYLWTTRTSTPAEASVSFYFETGGTTSLAGPALAFSKRTGPAATGATGVFTDSVHTAVTPSAWSIGIYDGATATLTSFGSGSLSLPTDGVTRFTLTVQRIAPDRVRVLIPGYLDTECRTPRLPAYWGPTVGTEHFQPSASYATDSRMIITGYRVGPAAARTLPIDPPTGMVGMPGAVFTYLGDIPTYAGYTFYYPFEVRDPITVTGVYAETTVAGTSGSRARTAIISADQSWQPGSLVKDFGEMATDAVAVSSVTGQSVPLGAGRYLLGQRMLSVAALPTMRYFAYGIPALPFIPTTLGGTPFAEYFYVIESYAAFPASPTAWNGYNTTAAYGFLCPFLLSWTGS